MPEALAERSELCATLRATDPQAPTLCGQWTAALLTAHLVQREQSLTEALGRLPVQRFQRDAARRLEQIVAERPYLDLVADFEAGPPRWSPWAIPALREAVNLTEYAVHHEDVRRAAGPFVPRRLPVARQRAVWRGLRVSAPLLLRRLPMGVRLAALDFGSVDTRAAKKGGVVVTVTGEPLELALLVMGRQQVAQVQLDGPDAEVGRLMGARLGI